MRARILFAVGLLPGAIAICAPAVSAAGGDAGAGLTWISIVFGAIALVLIAGIAVHFI